MEKQVTENFLQGYLLFISSSYGKGWVLQDEKRLHSAARLECSA